MSNISEVSTTRARFFQLASWPFFNIIFRIFFKFRVEGIEHVIGLKCPLIFISNHKSYIDHFLILASLPINSALIPIHVMNADWIFKRPMLGFISSLFGSFPALRGIGMENSLKIPKMILARGDAVGIYPEGGIVPGKDLGEPKRGIAVLALETGFPILPIAVIGTHDLTLGNFFLARRQVIVSFGKPFQITSQTSITDIEVWQSAKNIMSRIRELYYSKAS